MEPKKRRTNKQKRSLSKQGPGGEILLSGMDGRATDPLQFTANSEFSPVTPPDTPGTLVSFCPSTTAQQRQLPPHSFRTDIKQKTGAYSQGWTIANPIYGQPSAPKTLAPGSSGQLSSYMHVTASNTMPTCLRDWTALHRFQSSMQELHKPTKDSENTAKNRSKVSAVQPGTISLVPQPMSSPQPLHFNIQNLVYKGSPSPVKSTDVSATVQSSTDASASKSLSLDVQSSRFAMPDIKMEPLSQVRMVSTQFAAGLTSPPFGPHSQLPVVAPFATAHYRTQGVAAAGAAAPGKPSLTPTTVAHLYPHIHSSTHLSPQMFSGKPLMLSALSMSTQRKPPTADLSAAEAIKKVPIFSVSTPTTVLRSPVTFTSTNQLSLTIPTPRRASESGFDEKHGAALKHSAPPTAESYGSSRKSNAGNFSPLTPTELGCRDPITAVSSGGLSAKTIPHSAIPPQPTTIIKTTPVSTVLVPAPLSHSSLAMLKTRSFESSTKADSATDSAPETEILSKSIQEKQSSNTGAVSTAADAEDGSQSSKKTCEESRKPSGSVENRSQKPKSVDDVTSPEKQEPKSSAVVAAEQSVSPEKSVSSCVTKLIIDEEEKPDKADSSESKQSSAASSPSPTKDSKSNSNKSTASKSQKSDDVEDKEKTSEPTKKSADSISTKNLPVSWPKTKKQLARQQIFSSKTAGQ